MNMKPIGISVFLIVIAGLVLGSILSAFGLTAFILAFSATAIAVFAAGLLYQYVY